MSCNNLLRKVLFFGSHVIDDNDIWCNGTTYSARLIIQLENVTITICKKASDWPNSWTALCGTISDILGCDLFFFSLPILFAVISDFDLVTDSFPTLLLITSSFGVLLPGEKSSGYRDNKWSRLLIFCWFLLCFLCRLPCSYIEDRWCKEGKISSCQPVSVSDIWVVAVFCFGSFLLDAPIFHQC